MRSNNSELISKPCTNLKHINDMHSIFQYKASIKFFFFFVRFGEPNYLFENLEDMADFVIDQFCDH